MKKIFISLFISLLFPSITYGAFGVGWQGTTTNGLAFPINYGIFYPIQVPYILATSTTGTSTFTGGLKAGLISGTSGFSVLQNGNAGFGTQAPIYPIDVNGIARISTGVIISDRTSLRQWQWYGSGDNFFLWNGGANVLSIPPNSTSTFTYGVSVPAFTVSGNSYFPGTGIWNSLGNVGIGTIGPVNALDIVRTGADATTNYAALTIRQTSASSFGPSFILDASAGTGGHKYGFVSDGTLDGAGTGKLQIYDYTASATRFVINTSGDIGIGGVTAPTTLLHLYDNGGHAGDLFKIEQASVTGYASAGFFGSAGTQTGSFGYGNASAGTYPGVTFLQGASGVPLALGANGSEKVRITTTGKVGFGTTTPVAIIDSYTTASTTNLLLEAVSGGGCFTTKDVAGTGYTQWYSQAGVGYTKVATSLTICN